MKKINYLLAICLMLTFSECTDNFADFNTNPYQVSGTSLEQDFNHIGSYFPTMMRNLFGHQIEHNLVHESFVNHLATPTPFVAGRNNTTYYITWNTFWNRIYNNVMTNARQVIQVADEGGYDVFSAWAKLIRVVGTSRLSAYHGPIIYSQYGTSGQTILYDSEETLYNTWFAELDEVLAVFNANKEYVGLTKFDASFGGDVNAWIKVINSWRLILAMRISKVAPDLAKTEGEKAINEPGGLITAAGDSWYVSLYGNIFPPAQICFQWNDTRMSAAMESVLIGYKDPRIHAYFDEATDPTLYADHPDFKYKGIRNGALLIAKDDRLAYSTLDASVNDWTERRMITPADIHFTLAEAALRGWTTGGTAQQHYEAGVRASFAEWGAGGVDAYLDDDTSLPLDYTDPKATSADINSFTNRMTVTVKWDEAATDEVKLDRILTQKWIASLHNTIEIWVDQRRTGYPKIPYNYKNDSDATWGIIASDDFIKRMPFINAERNNNPAGVADAVTKMGGPDLISTRLWWDTGGPNFP